MVDNGARILEMLIKSNHGVYSNGRYNTGEGANIELVSPSTGSVIGTINEASEAQLDLAVESARQSFDEGDWAGDGQRRAKVLRRLAGLVDRQSDVIAYLDAIEAGKVIGDSVSEDVPDVAANLRYFADLISNDDGRYLQGPGGWGWVRKVPVGVVGAVLPWNYPIAMLGWKVAPALAAGNSMIIKPSEDSLLSALYFASLASEAGVPDGIFHVMAGTGPTIGRAMGLHPGIDVLTFTGSGPVGRSFLAASAESNLKKVALELGGRAVYIVDSQFASDFDTIAADIVKAAFGTSGQNCTASSRIVYVGEEDRRFGEFRTALTAATETLLVGDPLKDGSDIGPVINAKAHERITRWVEEALATGAQVVNNREEVPADGYWIAPTILEGVSGDSELGHGEIFGPVTQLIRLATRDEAVHSINEDDYGLASTVWCEDLGTMKWWSDRIRVGTLAINGYSEGTAATPFGGMRQSGFWGRDNGPEALLTYQESMTVWIAPS